MRAGCTISEHTPLHAWIFGWAVSRGWRLGREKYPAEGGSRTRPASRTPCWSIRASLLSPRSPHRSSVSVAFAPNILTFISYFSRDDLEICYSTPFRHGLGWVGYIKGAPLGSQCPYPLLHSSVLFLPFLSFSFLHYNAHQT